MALNPRNLLCRKTLQWSLALLFLSATTLSTYSQRLATLEVKLTRSAAGLQVPVHLMLDNITHLPDSVLQLVEVQGNKRTAVAFQVDGGTDRKLTWLMDDDRQTRRYELIRSTPSGQASGSVEVVHSDGALTLRAGEKNLLRYQMEVVFPPKSINPVFARGAFIHPLWSPRGHILTRIQPPDHYHHYGIWNPWTHVLYDGDTVDFWNLNARQGTVRFAGITSAKSGDVFAEFEALHDHIVFRPGQQPPSHERDSGQVAMRELQTVRTYAPSDGANYYITDISVNLNCIGKPVRLLEYRYGGLGWRATEQWTKENSRVLTSEGKTRKEADGSKARWCIVEGTVDGENAGAVMMSYPSNYNHPEPLRIWPENANRNRGDMFANFSPTKDMDWPLRPGKEYTLRYRLVVFDGQFNKEQAEAAWHDFAYPPTVTVVQTLR